MTGTKRVCVVLHAHLPWVREPEPWTQTERWFHEAMWECYAPLRSWLRASGACVTVSVSPPLAAMLDDAILADRYAAHIEEVATLNHESAPSAPLRQHYATLLDAARVSPRAWLADLSALPSVELMTTSLSHAFLPGLTSRTARRAQVALGRAAMAGVGLSRCMWLPECAWTPEVDATLAEADVVGTVLDAHGVDLSQPRVAHHALVSPFGVGYARRHRALGLEVWSASDGYPGHPSYRDFYRDLGFDREVGRLTRNTMTGLKYHRITDRRGDDKLLYDPDAGTARAEQDARDFATRVAAATDQVVVLAFDAELFGHWWHEGISFLAEFIRFGAESGLRFERLSSVFEAALPVGTPATSTWGRGGFARDWVNSSTARVWPRLHAAFDALEALLAKHRDAVGVRGQALDHAAELTLRAQASDWLYMMHGGPFADYASRRVAADLTLAARYGEIAGGSRATPEEAAALGETRTITANVGSQMLRRLTSSHPRP